MTSAQSVLDQASYEFAEPAMAVAAIEAITTEGSDIPVFIPTPVEPSDPLPGDGFDVNLIASIPRINVDVFRSDPRFANIDGSGFASVVIDSGIDLDHPHFGPDADGNGIADRIVHQQSFTGTATADDDNGHGTHVQATVASSDPTHEGVAPGADIIALKTQGSSGSGRFSDVERALQWVVANGAAMNVASVNMSIGDGGFYTQSISQYGIGDELAALAAMDIIVVSSSGNDFQFRNSDGVGYPSADPNSLSIGSERTGGGLSVFSQRDPELTTVFAPGERITAAWPGGGVRRLQGTSMASPHVAGAAILAQQLAVQELGRRLSTDEFEHLMRQTGPGRGLIPSTGADYPGVDMWALGDAILAMDTSDADLRGDNLVVTGIAERGDVGAATIDIVNDGTIASVPVTASLYLSRNDEISFTGDTVLATVLVPSIAAGQSSTVSFNFTLPDADASFWDIDENYTLGVWVDTDNVLAESDEVNNFNGPIGSDRVNLQIANLPQDLIADELTLVSSDAVRGGVAVVDFTVANLGAGPAPASRVAFYLSTDGVADPSTDFFLIEKIVDVVPGNGQVDGEALVTFPDVNDSFWVDGQDQYHLVMIVDSQNVVAETDETNNLNQGDGVDSLSLPILVPASSLFGTTYLDDDNDGVFASRADHRFAITHTFPGQISPTVVPSFTLTDLPIYASDAVLTVRVRGNFGQSNLSLNVALDSYINTFYQGTQPEGTAEIVAERSINLGGPQWENAIADGELVVLADPNVGGSYSTNNRNYIEVTLSYTTADENLAHGSFQAPLRVFRNAVTDAVIPAMGTAVGDATIELVGVGFLGAANRAATVTFENEMTVTMLGNLTSNALLLRDSDQITVDAATINRWLADGQLDANVAFGNGVSQATLGNMFELRLRYPIVSDDGLSGQIVTLDIDGNGTIDRSTTTIADDPNTPANEAGNYSFIGVPAGNHIVAVTGSADSTVTAPAGGQRSVDVVAGDSPRGVNFGVYQIPDTDGPTIENVWVNSQQWGNALKETFDDASGYSLVGVHQTDSVTWTGGVDEVVIQFSEDIGDTFAPEHFFLKGSDELNLVRPDSINYDPETFRVSIRSVASMEADRVLLTVFDTLADATGNPLDGEWTPNQSTPSGDSTPGGHFHFRFNVLSGDVDNSGSVTFGGDLFLVFANVGPNATDAVRRRFDIDGSGSVTFGVDLLGVFSLTGQSLPENEPTLPQPPSTSTTLGWSGGLNGDDVDDVFREWEVIQHPIAQRRTRISSFG